MALNNPDRRLLLKAKGLLINITGGGLNFV